MRRTIPAGLCLAALALACTLAPPEEHRKPRTGRERVLRALQPPPQRGGLLATSGLLSTALSSVPFLKGLGEEPDFFVDDFELELSDGTRVGGVLYDMQDAGGSDVLVISSFGLLQDRWGSEAAKVEKRFFQDAQAFTDEDFLILDHPSSGPFFANNRNLSLGSYDDARMWIEVARVLRRRLEPSSIHLVGVSMSGQTVVHALVEDARLGLGLFDSGIALSIAPDFRKAPGRQLARLPTADDTPNPWAGFAEAGGDASRLDTWIQDEALSQLFEKRFLPSYRRALPSDAAFSVEPRDVPVFLWKAFADRIAFLRERRPPGWRERFRLDSLEAYAQSTRIADVIGEVRTPLVLLSARDDPAIPREMFEEVAAAAQGNPWVIAYETPNGGHFGFDVVYGVDYLERVADLLVNPRVLRSWTRPPSGS